MSDDIDRIVQQLLSRRTFVQRMGAAGFALSGASAFLAACGGIEGENEGNGDGADATATPQAEKPSAMALSVAIGTARLFRIT